MRREWLADDFCRPCYEVWMSEAVARGRIYAPGFFQNPASRAVTKFNNSPMNGRKSKEARK